MRSLLTGQEENVAGSTLVMATTNLASDPFPESLADKTILRIRDSAAPRLAAYALHEGTKAPLAL
ncbi:MAG: hypothetical protein INF48_14660 [Rhodobacter sp.]|nr:hypothetical protein [Rhodobacter sp.]